MTIETWLAYVATVLVLMSTPGPSHLLMLSNSLSNGFARATATAAGDLSANVLQMLAAGLGMAALLRASEYGFTIIKWAGVGYLIWLGGRQIARSFRSSALPTGAPRTSSRELWLQGFVTSGANPKAVVFFAALFPQFLRESGGFWLQMAILGVTYLVIDGTFLCAYGLGAGWLGTRLRGPTKALLDRVAGGCLIVAAILLGLKSIRRA